GHHGDAVHAGDLAALLDLVHALVEKADSLEQVRPLVLLARDLVLAAQDLDVELHRAFRGKVGLVAHSAGILAMSASRRAPACGTGPASSRLRSCAVARSRRSDSFAARSARVCASSDASLRSSSPRSLSMG